MKKNYLKAPVTHPIKKCFVRTTTATSGLRLTLPSNTSKTTDKLYEY